jgi:ribbon-helix-helix CopG family protein
MEKTTVYLPLELKTALKRAAQRRGASEADIIRDAIRSAVFDDRPRPTPGLFASEHPIARDADTHLDGFGDR